jgi:hypothetical protein
VNVPQDAYLVSNMDTDGFAQVSLIASFRMVQVGFSSEAGCPSHAAQMLTHDVSLVASAIRSSQILEVPSCPALYVHDDWQLDPSATRVRARPVAPQARTVVMLRDSIPSSSSVEVLIAHAYTHESLIMIARRSLACSERRSGR